MHRYNLNCAKLSIDVLIASEINICHIVNFKEALINNISRMKLSDIINNFVKRTCTRIVLLDVVIELFDRSRDWNKRFRCSLRKDSKSLLGWLYVSSAGLEKAPDWVIKTLIKAAGGILKRIVDNRLETRPQATRIGSCRRSR